jgi:uncharacterized protein GlcG (DUF336 family)
MQSLADAATLLSHLALLSFVSVGGAHAVFPDVFRLVVTERGWMSGTEFATLVALSQAAPGPNVLVMALIGQKVGGFALGVAALVAFCLPSSVIAWLVARAHLKGAGTRWARAVRDGFAPVTVGLVLASGFMYVADTKRLTLAGARQMAATAVGLAEQAGIAITVAIADSGGNLVLLERMDGGRFHTAHSSTTKAVCAASNKRPTTMQGAQGQTLDTTHALGLALAAGPDRWTAMEGGFPVLVGGECIGGIGVSGGDWETDARIARAAVESIGAAWKL